MSNPEYVRTCSACMQPAVRLGADRGFGDQGLCQSLTADTAGVIQTVVLADYEGHQVQPIFGIFMISGGP